ncbi:MAG: 2-C-methyl-D-erythritol 2,4-cyclodiphosphate synthase [Clostridiales bacterium]|nr:2-C-methyl-D-erythritol 2,4-cyclodiphosphate synthase [Clostridiales bacterium]
MKAYAVILCGGSGSRMGKKENKTLLKIGGVPSAVRCVRAFAPAVAGTVLVARAGDEDLFRGALAAYGVPALAVVPGGEDRQSSALAGLRALPADADIALIHDGARPFVTEEIVRRVMESVETHGSGVAAVPARDTVKRADPEGRVLETLDRSELWQMQTPQGFPVRDLLRAHETAPGRYTDDAALMEAAGYPVRLVMGGYDNIKLTSPEDLRMANGMLTPRVGTGWDAHRLTEGRELWLGGVKIPYEKGLLGHSDADAALHALTDAMLGAAALGDIGKLFPDSDEKYKGISSLILLEEAARVIAGRGFSIGNVDVTILAQAPKLAPYIPQMREKIAGALKIGVDQVSVKATTSEGMGFEGRGEGISAQATAVLFR